MANFIEEDDDLDPGFVPDADVVKTSDDVKNQADTDTVVATRVEKPVAKHVQKEETPSMNDLLASKLVLIENQNSKVANVQDMHNAIAAQESVSRIQASNIQDACEDFLTPRTPLNSFSEVPSKLNYLGTKNYLAAKIAKETAILGESVKISAEDVMQYASTILEKAASAPIIEAPVVEKVEKAASSMFVPVGKEMVLVSKLPKEELIKCVETSTANDEVKARLIEITEAMDDMNIRYFIGGRISGVDFYGSVNMMTSRLNDGPVLDIASICEYAKTMYQQDMEQACKYRIDFTAEGDAIKEDIKNTEGSVTEYLERTKDILSRFRRMEAIEALTIVLPMCMAILSKLIESYKI